jgi:uncharacterized protein (TIGR02996 family)
VEAAFLARIADEPDDTVARLVFADWLAEQDEPGRQERAEFIRVQFALAARRVPADERARLVARQKALLERYRARWDEPLNEFVTHAEYRGGFVERVTLSVEQFVDGFADLVRLAPVVRVRPTGLTADTVSVVAATEALARVYELDLSGTHIGPDVLRELLASPHLGRLRALNLARTQIGDEGVRALVAAPAFGRLRYLNVSRAAVGPAGARALVSAIYNRTPALQVLVARGAERLPVGAFPPVPHGLPFGLRQSLRAQLGLDLGSPADPLDDLHRDPDLPPDLRRWAERTRARGAGAVPRATRDLPLPAEVRAAALAACRRRAVWRAGLEGFVPPDELAESTDLSELAELLVQMGGAKEERAFAALVLELYRRHARGDLPADGRTRA